MTKKVCIFGSLFQEARSQTALSQWEISVRAGTHLSNVNQVEAGNQEPNVILAVKMLLAVNADIQSFFMELGSGLVIPNEVKTGYTEDMAVSYAYPVLPFRKPDGTDQPFLSQLSRYPPCR